MYIYKIIEWKKIININEITDVKKNLQLDYELRIILCDLKKKKKKGLYIDIRLVHIQNNRMKKKYV